VEHLDLEDNWIENGGVFFGSALTSNICITYVNMSDNRLGRQSGLAIASMLAANKTIKTLLLAGIFPDKIVIIWMHGCLLMMEKGTISRTRKLNSLDPA
jgi:hypothetical protein